MFSLTQLFVFAAAISIAYGDIDKAANSSNDYYLDSQRALLHDIALVNVQIAEVDARILGRVDDLLYEHERLLNEISALSRTYYPTRAASPSRKYCLEKYEANFFTNDSTTNQLAVCHKIASDKAATYTSTAKSHIVSANDYATTTFSRSIAECDRFYSSSNKDTLEKCYTESASLAIQNVQKQLDAAKDALEKALFDSTVTCESARNCSFEVKKNALKTIGQINMSIQICLDCFQSNSSTSNC